MTKSSHTSDTLPGDRTIETSISISNAKDQIASFLYAIGLVHDDEDIVELRLKPAILLKDEGTLPITIKLTKRKWEIQ